MRVFHLSNPTHRCHSPAFIILLASFCCISSSSFSEGVTEDSAIVSLPYVVPDCRQDVREQTEQRPHRKLA